MHYRQATQLKALPRLTGVFALLLSFVVWSSPAGAIPASGSIATWPWAVGSNGAPNGAVCNISAWSFANGGASSTTPVWDNTHSSVLAYNCDVVGGIGTHFASAVPVTDGSSPYPHCPPVSAGPVIDEPQLFSGQSTIVPLGGASCVMAGGLVSSAQQTTIVSNSYNGTTSMWYRVSGVTQYLAGCQNGGSQTTGYCNGRSVGTDTYVPLTSAACTGTSGGPSVVQDDSAAGSLEYMKCVTTAGVNAPGYAPVRPDGSAVPAIVAGGTCHVGTLAMGLADNTPTGDSSLTTTNSAFALASGDTVTASAVVTFTSAAVTAFLEVRSTTGSVNQRISLTVGATSPTTVSGTFASAETTFYRLAITCGDATGTQLNQQNYDSTTQTNTAPGGGPIDRCGINCSGSQPSTGSALACFDGYFTTLNLFGFDVFPWVRITETPGDVICFVQAVTVGTAGDWSSQFQTMKADAAASSTLSAAGTLFAVPLNAWATFTSSYSSGSAGCTGPTMSMPMIDNASFHTHTTDVSPFSTCDSNISTVATLVRDSFTAGLWIGFAWFAFRVLSAAIGFSPGGAASDGDES